MPGKAWLAVNKSTTLSKCVRCCKAGQAPNAGKGEEREKKVKCEECGGEAKSSPETESWETCTRCGLQTGERGAVLPSTLKAPQSWSLEGPVERLGSVAPHWVGGRKYYAQRSNRERRLDQALRLVSLFSAASGEAQLYAMRPEVAHTALLAYGLARRAGVPVTVYTATAVALVACTRKGGRFPIPVHRVVEVMTELGHDVRWYKLRRIMEVLPPVMCPPSPPPEAYVSGYVSRVAGLLPGQVPSGATELRVSRLAVSIIVRSDRGGSPSLLAAAAVTLAVRFVAGGGEHQVLSAAAAARACSLNADSLRHHITAMAPNAAPGL
jgi:hypothetical protein